MDCLSEGSSSSGILSIASSLDSNYNENGALSQSDKCSGYQVLVGKTTTGAMLSSLGIPIQKTATEKGTNSLSSAQGGAVA